MRLRLLLALLPALLLAAPALAQKTWDGGAGTTQWTDGANWSPDGVPTSTDDVLLDGGAVVDLNANATINSLVIRDTGTTLTTSAGTLLTTPGVRLETSEPVYVSDGTLATGSMTLASGTLGGAGEVSADTLSFTRGTIEGSGTVSVAGGALLSGTSFARNLIGRTLRLEGTTVVSGGNPLRMGDAARIEVPSGAVFDLQSDGDIIRTGTITTLPVIAVEAGGAFTKSAATGESLIRAALANDGLVTVEAGTLRFGDGFGESGGLSTGVFTVAAGATLDFDDGVFDLTTADFSGAGTVDFGRVGAVTLTGAYDLASGATRLTGGAGDGVTFDASMTLQSLGQTLEVAGQATATLDLAPLTMPTTVDLSGGQAALLLAEALDVETLLLRIGSCRLGGSGDVTTDSLSFTG
ncbi:MAG: hypothetical protein R3181_11720, partial [Rubricoccaceae bacterium]|nr:hypothetical protein [Rubricoccaceae bacterium]